MGVSEAEQEGALRIGTGKFTTDEDIARAAVHIVQAVAALRRTMERRGA
jgi:cysteine sulfinate desulfinase/cysteine desulfurase-like protein